MLRDVDDLPSNQVIPALRAFAGLPGVSVEDASLVANAMDWAEAGMDFADALHLAAAAECEGLITFDKRLARFGTRLSGIPITALLTAPNPVPRCPSSCVGRRRAVRLWMSAASKRTFVSIPLRQQQSLAREPTRWSESGAPTGIICHERHLHSQPTRISAPLRRSPPESSSLRALQRHFGLAEVSQARARIRPVSSCGEADQLKPSPLSRPA